MLFIGQKPLPLAQRYKELVVLGRRYCGVFVSNVAKRVDVLLCIRSDDASFKKSGVVLKTTECRSFLGNGLEYLSVH
jgi:hypothetical protein